MKKPQRLGLALVAALGSHFSLFAQNAPVPFEAESGTSTTPPVAGATIGDWIIGSTTASGTVPAATYITTKTDQAGYATGSSVPTTAARVLTYSITFPGAGSYDLYARIWVGPGGFSDDSYYNATSFGVKSPTTSGDWRLQNGLASAGYVASSTQPVDGLGTAGFSANAMTPLWKWVNLSKFGSGASFTVPAGNLTQTLQIGAREDGLYFDKFVFGQTGLNFTVANLDAGTQGSAVVVTPGPAPTGSPIAMGKPKYLSSAYSTAQSPYFGVYWDGTTPENGGKWGVAEGTRGSYNWAEADAAYAQAVATGGPFRFHTLIWGAQQPTWLTTSGLSDADKLAAIKDWYQAVATHFQGKRIDFIDVVNEPTHQPPTGAAGPDGGAYLNALGGSGATGWDWVITAFQMARQYFPNSKLMLNEYSVENEPNRAATYVGIAKLLKDRGLIDAIGIQGHSFSLAPTSTASIQANMATLASANLPLYITEFDLDGATDAQQLADYQRIFPLFWENPAVRGITMWGYRPGHWRTNQGAYIANADNSERPALTWLRSYVASTYTGPMWTGTTSAAWATASNWITNNGAPANALVSAASTYTLPAATDDVVFPGYAANQPTVSSAQSIRNVTLGTGSTLTTNAVLTLTGNLTNNGGAVAGTGTVALGGSSAQTIGGTTATTFPSLTVGSATASLVAPASVRQMLTLNGNLTTNGRAFTLLSTATGTAMVVNTNGAVVGNATVQRYIDPTTNAGNGYRHYAAPVASTTVADLATSGFSPVVNPAYNQAANPYVVTPFPTVFGYNGARLSAASALTSAFDYGWESPAALTDVLTPGLGYSVNIPGTETVDFVGALNNGPISRTNLGRGPQADAGWQLLGNPYPSPLDWDAVSTTGLDAAVYVFRSTGPYAGTYSTYVPNGPSVNGGTKQLAAMQGFFVRTTSASAPGSINFTNAARLTTYASPTFQRITGPAPLVRLALGAATGPADEAVVYFPGDATIGFDPAADAYKLAVSGTPLLASELSATDLLAINALPALGAATVTVPLRVQAPQAGSYTLRATELLNLPAGVQALLRDAQTGTLFDLSQSTGYTVSLGAGATAAGRFALVLRPSSPLATAAAALSEQVSLYPNPTRGGRLSLGWPTTLGQQAIEAQVLNALGQPVFHQTLAPSATATRPLALPVLAPGIYTVRLQTNAGTIIKRLTIE
ncbi:endo-1,4-beta-xylanase [Hymenobacter sp. BT559]|uniref:endo-1,4-beta-xylanase n=1 Tax=Hymenobacter sp. BT559 TaxID=2795729 RepID=UPI0018EBFAFC|nr:endo-1,4-beta-xylanase [Hymenobacter sp. BT559]MBJ6145063.1 endo-1,4-beta-xylanase [Hymenobacter sp. BT559]